MNIKRKCDITEERTEVKKFSDCRENNHEPLTDVIANGITGDGSILNNGGIVIQSFYGTSKMTYVNPLKRKAFQENSRHLSEGEDDLKDTGNVNIDLKRQLFNSESNSVPVCANAEMRKFKIKRNSNLKMNLKTIRLKKRKVMKYCKPLHDNKIVATSQCNSSNAASVNWPDKKFFRNRSPRKREMLSKRGPAVLLNQGCVKFQLKCGPKLQKPTKKILVLPKKKQFVQRDVCKKSAEEIAGVDRDSDVNISTPDTPDKIAGHLPLSSALGHSPVVANTETVAVDIQSSAAHFEPNDSVSEASDSGSATDMQTEAVTEKPNKLFPLFGSASSSPVRRSPRQRNTNAVSKLKTSSHPKKTEQMILDFGQKLIGSVPCSVCGMTYLRGDKADEIMHNKFHQRLLNALKFVGWQKERVVQDFFDGSRVILVIPDDKFALKKMDAIKNVVDEDLGFVVDESINLPWKAFLYIKEKKIVGFCLAQSISQGYRMLSDDQSQGQVSGQNRPYCCVEVPVSVQCGISRIWVLSAERRKHIATKLLDVVRSQFVMGYPLNKDEIAFSDPTPDGIKFAANYTGTTSFLVFRK